MSLKQTIKQSQCIKLIQSQMFHASIKELRGNFYPSENTSAVIKTLIQKFLGNIQDKKLKDVLTEIFAMEGIQEMMSEQAVLLSIPKKENLDNFVYGYLFENMLALQNDTTNSETIAQEKLFEKGHKGDFIKAFKDREALVHEIEVTKSMVRIGGESTVREFKVKSKILETVDILKEFAENIVQAMQFLLTTKISQKENKEGDTETNVLNFLREKVILEEISDFSSERLLKRFLYRLPAFQKKNEDANCRDLEYRTMDIIGEFMLISLGIISSEMFKTNKFSIDPEKIDDLIRNTNNTRDELASLFSHYNLRGIQGEPIFYTRWFTQNQIPSQETDTLVKDFIKKLKDHREKIFENFGYDEFENNIIKIKRDKSADDEEKCDGIVDELNKRLSDENFMKTMTQILVEYRYKETYTLINPKK